MNGRTDILRRLEPVGAPHAPLRTGRGAPRRTGLEQSDFRTLIELVESSVPRSHLPVALPGGFDLTAAQRDRLALAADEAAAFDARNALVLLDGRPLLLDVHAREVTEEVQAKGERDRILTDIDTFIVSSAGDRPGGEPAHRLLLARLGGVAPRSVTDLLALHEEAAPTRTTTPTSGGR